MPSLSFVVHHLPFLQAETVVFGKENDACTLFGGKPLVMTGAGSGICAKLIERGAAVGLRQPDCAISTVALFPSAGTGQRGFLTAVMRSEYDEDNKNSGQFAAFS